MGAVLSRPDGENTVSEEVTVQDNRGGDVSRPEEIPSQSVNQRQPSVQLKPILLPLVSNERGNPPALSVGPARKAPSPPPTVRFYERNATLKPFLLGTSAASIPVIFPSSTMVPFGSRRISEGRRVGKREISAPRVAMTEVEPEAFERPRRPPEYST